MRRDHWLFDATFHTQTPRITLNHAYTTHHTLPHVHYAPHSTTRTLRTTLNRAYTSHSHVHIATLLAHHSETVFAEKIALEARLASIHSTREREKKETEDAIARLKAEVAESKRAVEAIAMEKAAQAALMSELNALREQNASLEMEASVLREKLEGGGSPTSSPTLRSGRTSTSKTKAKAKSKDRRGGTNGSASGSKRDAGGSSSELSGDDGAAADLDGVQLTPIPPMASGGGGGKRRSRRGGAKKGLDFDSVSPGVSPIKAPVRVVSVLRVRVWCFCWGV